MPRPLRLPWHAQRGFRVLALILAATSLALASCTDQGTGVSEPGRTASTTPPSSTEPTPDARSTPPLPADAPQQGGTLRAGGLEFPEWENPLWAEPFSADSVGTMIFESLLDLDPQDGHLLPGLAEQWDVGPGGQVITFTLRSGVSWHDGHPFSAEDVAATWRAVMGALAPIPHTEHLASVNDVDAPDERTVVIHLRQRDCATLTQLGLLPVLPSHLWKASDILAPTMRPGLMVGTGPFRLVDWQAGETITLTSESDHWDGGPYLDSWTYRRYESPSDLLSAARAREVDLFSVGSPLTIPSDLGPHYNITDLPAGELLYLLYNQQRPGLSEREVRHALALAVDRDHILRQTAGRGELVAALLPRGHWSLSPDLQTRESQPEEAQRLLSQLPEPLSLSLKVLGGDRLREDVALLVTQAYQRAGVEARLEVLEQGAYLERLFHRNFDVALVLRPFPRDPDQTALWHSREITPGVGFNFGTYVSPQVDELLDAGRTADGCAKALRASSYWKLSELVEDDTPADFLFAPIHVIAIDRRVTGPAPSPFVGLYWNVDQWHVSQGAQPTSVPDR